MFRSKIKLRPALLEKVKLAAERVGCSSVAEFIERTLEREVTRVLAENNAATGAPRSASQSDVQKIADKLKGLGYLE